MRANILSLMEHVLSLKGKIALVTGASSGIGRATAILFARLGARLALVGRQVENLSATRDRCLAEGHLQPADVVSIQADLATEAGVQTAFQETMAHFGTLHILINNAGIGIPDTIETVNMSQFDQTMAINLRACVHLTHLCTPALIANKGAIVNVSSVNGMRAFCGVMSYCISKAALDQFTATAALDLAPKGVRVNSVNPGVIVTEIHKRGGMSEEAYSAFLERSKQTHALGRTGDVEEVARAIAFLSSDAASFTTGAQFPVDGGRHAMCPR